jgi:hypothetical protein
MLLAGVTDDLITKGKVVRPWIGIYLRDIDEKIANYLDLPVSEGVIVTDWGALNDRLKAFEAGLDLEMPSSAGYFDPAVIAAVQSGVLPEACIDACVDRLLELVFRLHPLLQPASANTRTTTMPWRARSPFNGGALKTTAPSCPPARRHDRLLGVGAVFASRALAARSSTPPAYPMPRGLTPTS